MPNQIPSPQVVDSTTALNALLEVASRKDSLPETDDGSEEVPKFDELSRRFIKRSPSSSDCETSSHGTAGRKSSCDSTVDGAGNNKNSAFTNCRRVPPRDMKRLCNKVKYKVVDVDEWAGKLVLVLEHPSDRSDVGRYKLPTTYGNVNCQVGDTVELLATGFSQSRNLVALHVQIEDAQGKVRHVPPCKEEPIGKAVEKKRRSSSSSMPMPPKKRSTSDGLQTGGLKHEHMNPVVAAAVAAAAAAGGGTFPFAASGNNNNNNAQSHLFGNGASQPSFGNNRSPMSTANSLFGAHSPSPGLDFSALMQQNELQKVLSGHSSAAGGLNALLLNALSNMNASFLTTPQMGNGNPVAGAADGCSSQNPSQHFSGSLQSPGDGRRISTSSPVGMATGTMSRIPSSASNDGALSSLLAGFSIPPSTSTPPPMNPEGPVNQLDAFQTLLSRLSNQQAGQQQPGMSSVPSRPSIPSRGASTSTVPTPSYQPFNLGMFPRTNLN